MQILTSAEMRAADERTTAEHGVPSLTLMENAGQAVSRFVLRHYPAAQRITVLCGKGNNGGDGFVAARLLAAEGRQVSVLLLAETANPQGDAAAMFQRLRNMRPSVRILAAADAVTLTSTMFEQLFAGAELFVDAVLGTGFKPPMRGLAVALRERIAAMIVPVVAVDVPSGWDADSTSIDDAGAFRADAVVTFTAPKLAHVFGHMTRGPVVVAGIGSPEVAVQSESRLTWTGGSKWLTEQPRAINGNKGKYGHVIVFGGSRGKAGAPGMASLAAMRAGAGLVTVAVPECIAATVAAYAPELMLEPLCQTAIQHGRGGTISLRNLEAGNLQPLLNRKTVVAIGPGLSREPDAAAFVRGLLDETQLPMVLDADALNAFEKQTRALNGKGRTLVLTPHPGEMARLLGCTIKDVEADRVNIARRFAQDHALTLVLKGWRTLVAHPDGTVAVNTTGNPAMAKGGSGDILTGIVAAMLAQYPEHVADAVNAAVYLHGLAGDLALREQDEHTMLATDTVAHLWRAFRYRNVDEDGFTWLSGLRA